MLKMNDLLDLKSSKLVPFEKKWIPELFSWIKTASDLYLWSGETFRQEFSHSIFVKHLQREKLHPFCLSNDVGNMMAYGDLLLQGSANCNLCRVIVHPSMRSHGLGRQFCKLMMNIAYQRFKCEIMKLNVLGSNKPALACYHSLGFKVDLVQERARLVDGKKHDLIYMSSDLKMM